MATNFPKPVKPTPVSKVKTDWHLPPRPKRKPAKPAPPDTHNYINSSISGNINSAHYTDRTKAGKTRVKAVTTDHVKTKKPKVKYG